MRHIDFTRQEVKTYLDNYFRVHLANFFLSKEDFIAHHLSCDKYYFRGNCYDTPTLNNSRCFNEIDSWITISDDPTFLYLQKGTEYPPEIISIYNTYYKGLKDHTKYNFIFTALLVVHTIAQKTWTKIDEKDNRVSTYTNLGCGLMDLPKFSVTISYYVLKVAGISICDVEKPNLIRAIRIVAPLYLKRIKRYTHERNHPNRVFLKDFITTFTSKCNSYIRQLQLRRNL